MAVLTMGTVGHHYTYYLTVTPYEPCRAQPESPHWKATDSLIQNITAYRMEGPAIAFGIRIS